MKHLFIIHGLARADKKKRKAFDRLMAGIDRLEGDVEVQYTRSPGPGPSGGILCASTPAAGMALLMR